MKSFANFSLLCSNALFTVTYQNTSLLWRRHTKVKGKSEECQHEQYLWYRNEINKQCRGCRESKRFQNSRDFQDLQSIRDLRGNQDFQNIGVPDALISIASPLSWNVSNFLDLSPTKLSVPVSVTCHSYNSLLSQLRLITLD